MNMECRIEYGRENLTVRQKIVFYMLMNLEKPLENQTPLEQFPPKNPSAVLEITRQQEQAKPDTTKRIEDDNIAIADIRGQIGLAPENVEKSLEKGIILSPLSLKEKLLDSLDPIFLKVLGISANGDLWAETTKEITSRYTSTKDFSNEAGNFFKELIPQGIRKPEVAGHGRHDFTLNPLIRKEVNAFAHPNQGDSFNKVPRKILKENLKKFFAESIFRKERKPYESGLKESKYDGVTSQEVSRAMNQQNGENVIYEQIKNDMHSINGVSYSESSLVIQDINSGIVLDLDALLPRGFNFKPGLEDLDLKKYSGASASDGRFYASPWKKVVAYGNITEKGGMLSLFHEIAHAWQANYSAEIGKGRHTYEKLTKESLRLMEEFDDVDFNMERRIKLGLLTQNNFENAKKEYKEKIKKIFEELSSIGTEPLVEEGRVLVAEAAPVDKEGVMNLQPITNIMSENEIDNWDISQESRERLKKKRFHPIKNKKLEEARDAYISEERDAWAHALRMMRFLKQKGLNIEPGFKKLADVKEHIDPCLGSYQKGLEMDIKLSYDDYRFSRLPQK